MDRPSRSTHEVTSSDLPRVYPVAAETWTGPAEDPRPVRRRVASTLGWVLYSVVGAVVMIAFPAAVPWALGVMAVCVAVHVVVVVLRARRSPRARPR